ncbi:MAG: AAA family ATPase [Polyangiaceae bacterium]|nr:AAA family ATPase [Polyangiaceae bacterium]MCW5791945.1 AAA family ATPase [Polyangiaceae bacterium]
MLLGSFEFSNFLSHRNTVIKLQPVTVFVGPCNSGKSAVFDGLLNLAQLASGRISQAFAPGPWSYLATLNRQAAPNGQIGFSVTFSNLDVRYDVSYRELWDGAHEEPRYEILTERLLKEGVEVFDRSRNKFEGALSVLRDSMRGDRGLDKGVLAAIRAAYHQGGAADLPRDLVEVALEVSRIVKYRFESSNLRRVGGIDLERQPRLRPRGEQLASVLYYNDNGDREQFATLKRVLGEVIPGFEGFEFNTTREQDVGFSVRFSDGRGVVSAARLSDGTLHFIGLASLLILGGEDLPAVVCLEEPEVGLNSVSMRKLVTLIDDVAQHRQILVSTHSPYLLTKLWNREGSNPFECVHYVTIEQEGECAGFSCVRPMRDVPGDAPLRLTSSVEQAAKILDGRL